MDALGGLRARLDADERPGSVPEWAAWPPPWSGSDREPGAAARAFPRGRLRTFLNELSPRLQEGQAAAERAATRARDTGNSGPERALREVGGRRAGNP